MGGRGGVIEAIAMGERRAGRKDQTREKKWHPGMERDMQG